ncbi:MAG: sugar phosphate isomerase/epimerase family protein [Terriglobia bacterium]
MSQKLPRRQFLQTAGTAAAASFAAAATAGIPAGRGSAAPSATPRLFSGCCAYSYRKFLQHGPMTMEDFIRKAVELRIDGVDMTGYYYKSTEPAYLAGLRHLAYKHGVPFSGVACGVSTVQADAAKREQALVEIKKWVDVTDQLGAPHLRIFAGKLPEGYSVEQGMGWVVDAMKAASDYSGKKGIMVGVEDHSGITQNSETCLEIMHRVNSPYAGINLDITHFLGGDPYRQIQACIPYATNTHIRDVFDDQTPIDLERVWRMFAQAGFKGYMSAEYEGKEDPSTGVPKLIAKIRHLCRQYSSV